jgi:formylglycine-generating enzyme required for sulfatase activity
MPELTEVALIEQLCGLLPAQFELLLTSARAERHILSATSAPQAMRAIELVTWSGQSLARRQRLLAELARAREDIAANPFLDWQQACYESYRHVRIVGFENLAKVTLDLDDVFVELDVRAGRARQQRPLRLEKEPEHFEESLRVGLIDALQLVERVRLDGRKAVGLALIGDPGAGKTTLLKYLFCRVLRKGGSQALGLPADLTPVFVRFARVEPADLRARGLDALVRRQADADGKPGAADDLLGRDARPLFLLDGLDEVRDQALREDVSEWLREEVQRWGTDARFVVTCRFAAYRGGAVLDNQFIAAEIQWLDDERVRQYVRRWFKAVGRGLRIAESLEATDRAAHEQAQELLKTLLDPRRQQQYGLREMTENPLLLSTLCLVHHAGDRLPEQRGDLFEHCIDLLLYAWAKARGQREHLPPKPARLVLQPLAWAMQEERARNGQRPFSSVEVLAVIEEALPSVPALAHVTAERFLELARDNCGVLASRDVDSYEFFHLAFQEYLAAAHAVERGRVTDLAALASEAAWREPILLAMSMPGAFTPFMQKLLRSKEVARHGDLLRECFEQAALVRIDEQPFAEFVRRTARAKTPQREAVGIVAALFAEREAPTLRKALERLTFHADAGLRRLAERVRPPILLSAHLTATATMVARLTTGREDEASTSALVVVRGAVPAGRRPGDAWTEPTTGLTLVWIPPGEFVMGSSKTKREPGYDPEADDRELPARRVRISEGFWIGQHPVTNEQYGRLVAEGGAEPEYWRNRRFNGPQQPVVGVRAIDARAFCHWAAKRAGLTGELAFDLPTEAEWEFTARGREGRRYPWGQERPTPERAVWGQAWEAGAAAIVGQRPRGATPLGVHDLAGNVWEWCLDAWTNDYRGHPSVDVDPCIEGERAAPRVLRGGSWFDDARILRCATRDGRDPLNRNPLIGFRVVCRRFRQHVAL